MIGSRFRSVAPFVGAALLIGCGGSDSGGSAADWCDFAAQAEVVDETFDSLGTDPASIEEGLEQVKAIAEDLPDKAPSEIKGAANVLSESALQVVGAFEDADFSLLDADLSFLDDADLANQVDEANAEIDEYTQRECGRSFGTDDGTDDSSSGDVPVDTADTVEGDDDGDDDGGFDPSAGTLREQLVIQFESIGLTNAEATCIADKLDFNDPAVQSGDIAAMLDVFGECNIGLDRLGELGGG